MSHLYERIEELIYFTMTCAIFNILFIMRGIIILSKKKTLNIKKTCFLILEICHA